MTMVQQLLVVHVAGGIPVTEDFSADGAAGAVFVLERRTSRLATPTTIPDR